MQIKAMATELNPADKITSSHSEEDRTALIGLAYRYALPLYEIARLRYKLEFDPARTRHLAPDHLVHKRSFSSPEDRLITAPNADTLYSIAMLDLSSGAVRIDVPEMDGRYYSIALIDAYTNVFAYIGRRTTGTHAGSYLLVGPAGKDTRQNAPTIFHAPTPTVVLLIRILLNGPGDLDTVHRLQDQFRLTAAGAPARHSAPMAPVIGSGENFVEMVNQALVENPPPVVDAPMLERIGQAGVGPHAVPFTPELRQAWNDRFAKVQQALATVSMNRHERLRGRNGSEIVNGWIYPPADKGNFGTDYDARAVIALAGLFAHRREENLAVGAVADSEGRPLDKDARYRLQLPAQMPVDGFWSLSVYSVEPDGRRFFADNVLHRWAISDRTPGLDRNADGSLDILIQRDPPDDGEFSNWLPLPDCRFHLGLRNYEPRAELLEGRFRYPAIERIG